MLGLAARGWKIIGTRRFACRQDTVYVYVCVKAPGRTMNNTVLGWDCKNRGIRARRFVRGGVGEYRRTRGVQAPQLLRALPQKSQLLHGCTHLHKRTLLWMETLVNFAYR